MIDTLKLAKDLREGDLFSDAQAERLAGALGQFSDEKRLKDVEVRLGVLTWVVGLQLAIALAVLWQVFALRGEVSALAADSRARLTAVEQRLGDLTRPPGP